MPDVAAKSVAFRVRMTAPGARQEAVRILAEVREADGDAVLAAASNVITAGGDTVGTGIVTCRLPDAVPWTPADTIDFSGEDRYDVTIRLTATDPGGNSGNDFVQLRFIIVN